MTPRRLALAGASLLLLTVVLAFTTVSKPPVKPKPPPVPVTTTSVTTTTTKKPPSPPPPPKPKPPKPTPPPIRAAVAMSWNSAGAIVWHWHDSDPEWLGQNLRAAGFGWVAVYLGQAGTPDPPSADWIARLRQASGLPVGGWSVLGPYPQPDVALAVSAIKQDGLAFYIADAEQPYEGHPNRSPSFVTLFRAAEPTLPAGLSSLCNAQGIGLEPWAKSGFAFLPQAYVNDFGMSVSPAACVKASSAFFPLSSIHPTVGSYQGMRGYVSVQQWTQLLAAAKTTGFSVYPAETAMTAQGWEQYGAAITSLHIAARAS